MAPVRLTAGALAAAGGGRRLLAADGLRHVGFGLVRRGGIRSLAQLKPDLVLLDIHLPGSDGVETARIIRREAPEAVVILLSANPDGFDAPGLAAGAVALLDKCDLRARALDELWLEHRPAAG